MFRKLFWIVEQCGTDGCSRVTGIYTSIQDLVGKGLVWSNGGAVQDLRLTLIKPDTFDQNLGTWKGPEFAGMATDMQAFILRHEFSQEEVDTLSSSLAAFTNPVA